MYLKGKFKKLNIQKLACLVCLSSCAFFFFLDVSFVKTYEL